MLAEGLVIISRHSRKMNALFSCPNCIWKITFFSPFLCFFPFFKKWKWCFSCLKWKSWFSLSWRVATTGEKKQSKLRSTSSMYTARTHVVSRPLAEGADVCAESYCGSDVCFIKCSEVRGRLDEANPCPLRCVNKRSTPEHVCLASVRLCAQRALPPTWLQVFFNVQHL